ncbi:purine-binding chemotaxis protein CheW [Halanaerobium congolense]|uniref:Purine-binding chemotaxis protein CheW n=1 Tax=Halanaerobium congolense TaxID=54121 RepID=A0A1I0DD49_9FIRM|nr:chemotaxis protein CheW [Halanaerobium congolense]PTX14787.1 purine-binding chemotaxis protein CheW [Halanaerobium congolense]SDG27382.1 purine-binding chemotaxis protein CheW [Halanaerobium congolense]SDH02647.1 purine-binding chemotaxis protein CheW [Halanaerobium congolense]SET29946.1 purine-binding chemotaxis protein CheW [Halanaerobium congolense]SFP82608.1 purine-binding chemotaxis protein CheW [Halanaerobium congolense]
MSKDNNDLSRKQYITFSLGQERYGIELNEGKEILLPPEITRVPNTPDYVNGVINLRGGVITILDFKDILGIEKNKNDGYKKEEKRIIITTIGNITSGFMVDQMQGILTLAGEDIEKENKNEMKSEFIKGIYTEANNVIPIIDLKRLISSRKEAI